MQQGSPTAIQAYLVQPGQRRCVPGRHVLAHVL